MGHGLIDLLQHPQAVVGELALQAQPAYDHLGGLVYPTEILLRLLPVVLLVDAQHVDPQTQGRLALQLGVR